MSTRSGKAGEYGYTLRKDTRIIGVWGFVATVTGRNGQGYCRSGLPPLPHPFEICLGGGAFQ